MFSSQGSTGQGVKASREALVDFLEVQNLRPYQRLSDSELEVEFCGHV